jgi:hypothetical protein
MAFSQVLKTYREISKSALRAIRFVLVIVYLTSSSLLSQYKQKQMDYFGFQYRPLIPVGIVGDRPIEIGDENFSSIISPKLGYNFGGVVRFGLTQLISIETGLSYTRRTYGIQYLVPDSLLMSHNTVGFINYDIPVNLLVYITLGKEFYMNTSLGGSLNFYPSNVRNRALPGSQHQFIFEGRRGGFFSTDINANVGFEYRTEKSGIFYMGFSGKVPIQPIFIIATEYRFDTFREVRFGQVDGATLSLDFKYFFHTTPKKDPIFKPGPIEH